MNVTCSKWKEFPSHFQEILAAHSLITFNFMLISFSCELNICINKKHASKTRIDGFIWMSLCSKYTSVWKYVYVSFVHSTSLSWKTSLFHFIFFVYVNDFVYNPQTLSIITKLYYWFIIIIRIFSSLFLIYAKQ